MRVLAIWALLTAQVVRSHWPICYDYAVKDGCYQRDPSTGAEKPELGLSTSNCYYSEVRALLFSAAAAQERSTPRGQRLLTLYHHALSGDRRHSFAATLTSRLGLVSPVSSPLA